MNKDFNEQIINPDDEEEKVELNEEAKAEVNEEIYEEVNDGANEEINRQPVCESENESRDSIDEDNVTEDTITENKDRDSKKAPESITLKTGDYIIKVNKAGTNHFDLLEEMYKLKNNTELSGKEKNARLKDVLSKKHKII